VSARCAPIGHRAASAHVDLLALDGRYSSVGSMHHATPGLSLGSRVKTP